MTPAAEHDVWRAPEFALLHPIKAGNAFEETVERLLQMIKLGIVPPGERLPPERELAARLGVSRATLRDALSELTKSDWVEVRRGRAGGTFVRSADEGTDAEPPAPEPVAGLADVLSVRWVLEVGVAELAAGRDLPASTRRDLGAHLDAVCAASLGEYRRLDSRLHLAIAEATGSSTLVRHVASSRTAINGLLGRIPLLEPNLKHSNEQHRRIVTAILGGDTGAARSAMVDHLDGTAALLRGFLS